MTKIWGALVGGLGWLLMMGLTPAYAEVESSCLERCVVEHPDYGFPQCRQLGDFLQGETCFEVFNDCLQSCQMTATPERYIPPPTQVDNRWRQRTVCEDSVVHVPYELLPANIIIDPRWSGQCECFNGQFFVARCGHEPATCNEVCAGTARF